MNVISDKTQGYLKMLSEKFNKEHFCDLIKNLLNLQESDIVSGREKCATSNIYMDYIEHSQLYAKYEDNNKQSIGILIIKLKNHKQPANGRTLQRNYISHLMEYYELDASLTVIYSDTDDTWRLSFVKKEGTIELGKYKEKVSPAKRYSYLLGVNEPNHTAKEQLLELLEKNDRLYNVEEIEEKFSVEKVTKDFFDIYEKNYKKLKENLEKKNSEFSSEAKRCGFTAEEFTKKLLGQIVFIYFLQKKGWLGVKLVPSKLSFDEYNQIYVKQDVLGKKILDKYYINFNGNKKIKNELLEKPKENEQDIEILSTIFVNTKYDQEWGSGEKKFIRTIFENCKKRNKNFFDDYLEQFFYNGLNCKRKNQYFSVFNCKIPFLNGGLFEPLDNYMWESATFNIDNEIFSNKDDDGILDFFDRYNFTMNEEEPLEKDIAVDPEMLGKIFENLLDVEDRKSKGAYYSPRSIVHYLCQESIANYLVNKVGIDYKEIKEFIQYGEMIRDVDVKNATKEDYLVGKSIFKNIIEIDKALKNIKVADPSVGSGAFPLGMLNEIVKMRDILTSYLLLYNKLGLFNKKYPESEITKKRSIYNIKRSTIKNCIYAVDLENSAVDITKLRLWLSIVVDQVNVPKTGPEPLPNLDCTIMQGNSLVDEFKGISLIDDKLIYELRDRNNNKLNPSPKEVSQQIAFGDDEKKAFIEKLIRLKKELYETNEPSIKKEKIKEIKGCRRSLLERNFRTPGLKEELFKEDNSHKKQFFSWKLEFIEVFIEKGGFDVVIGNPPYVGEKGNKEIFEKVAITKLGKKFKQGKMDLFYYFFHKGINLLNDIGELKYITTNYFITATGANKLRKDLKTRTSIRKLINFNEYKIFKSAMGQHNMITELSKQKLDCAKTVIVNLKSDISDGKIDDILYERTNDKELFESYELPYDELYDGEENYIRIEGCGVNNKKILDNILNKMKKSDFTLIKIANIKQGIVSGADKYTDAHQKKYKLNFPKGMGIFVIDTQSLKKLNITNEELIRYVKPVYKNSQISKYCINYNNDLNVFYMTKEVQPSDAPVIIKYLSQFKPILESKRETLSGKIPWYSLNWPRDKSIFEASEKIVNSRRAKSNIFALETKEYYEQSDIMITVIREEFKNVFKTKFVLGLLNSKLYYVWMKNRGKVKGDLLELYGKPLEEIPIKKADDDIQNGIVANVESILKNGIICKTELNNIDNMVYKLFELSSEEIEVVENIYKQSHNNGKESLKEKSIIM